MLFGTKETFGIEIEINKIYCNQFIGDGFFVIHINNNCYGRREEYATTFPSIARQLRHCLKNRVNSDMALEDYSKGNIVEGYYLQNYSEANLSDCDKKLLSKTKTLWEWSPDEAFDDGSHVIHFDDNDTTRIIGFKSCIVDGDCKVMENSCSEIQLPREDFKGIIKDAYLFLKSFSANSKT